MTLQPATMKIDVGAIHAEADNLFTPTGKNKILAHSEILTAILDTLEEIDFKAVAGLDDEEKLPQKHLLVLCVNELLSKVKEQNLDLARKDDFIFAFNGAYWKELNREIIKNFLGNVAERLSVHSLEAQHYKFKNELYNQFLSSAHFEPIEQRSDVVLINLLNGTFEISKDGQALRDFNARDFLPYQLPFEFDEAATCPMFQKYLDEVLPEKELQDIVAEFFGYIFTKGLKMEKAMLLYGSGANGKSVLFDIINALLGRENISNFSLSNLLEEHNRALIAYKLLNYGSEINATKTRDEFKNLVSTEPIQARLKYGNSFTMENYAKLAFNCNELPKDFDHQHAYFRRLLIIPFRVTIPENKQDKTLAGKIIKTELAGVFNWIIDGLKRLLKTEKFTESQIVKDTLETYKRESDSVACFIAENSYKPSSNDYTLLKDLYAEYRAFCLEDGASPLKKLNFKRRLESNGFQIMQMNDGIRVYLGKDYDGE
ncbi:MAG TPA: phage/plasmid primase, P4 family, partial [Pyrinomonadaceae bacterium]|nr:phage/plasmid primase, P4 family [Pyrinomonadaceae bacterium]